MGTRIKGQEEKKEKMKNIIKAIIGVGMFGILFSTGYFLQLYTDFTQLILFMGVVETLMLLGIAYLYDYLINNDEEKRLMDKSIDLTRDWVYQLEEKIKEKKK